MLETVVIVEAPARGREARGLVEDEEGFRLEEDPAFEVVEGHGGGAKGVLGGGRTPWSGRDGVGLDYGSPFTTTPINMLKTFLPAVLALGLVACTAETSETVPPADGNAADMGTAQAQTVTLRLTGMT